MSDLVGNPEDRFSRVMAQIKLMKTTHQFLIELHLEYEQYDYVKCSKLPSVYFQFKTFKKKQRMV